METSRRSWLENAVKCGFINQNIRGEERSKKLIERATYKWEHFEE
jgi:hypothetical protein